LLGGGGESDLGGESSYAELNETWEALLDTEASSDSPSPAVYSYLELAHDAGNSHPKVQSALHQTQIRELADLRAAWGNGDLDGATSILEALSPTNSTEAGLKELWVIRLAAEREARAGQYNPEEREVLHAWSAPDAWHTGSAWVMAQGMLGLSDLPGVWEVEAEVAERLAVPDTHVKLLYPNPAQDLVYWQGMDEEVVLQIVDMKGRIWIRESLPSGSITEVSIAHLPDGLYVMEASTPEGHTVLRDKLQVQR
jgi:hypothetical protein